MQMLVPSVGAAVMLIGLAAGSPALADTGPLSATIYAPKPAANSAQAATAQQIVNEAWPAVLTMKSNYRFNELLMGAKGVVIMPDLPQGASAAGARGVLLQHHGNGGWSDPAFVSVGSPGKPVSPGAPASGNGGSAALVLMSDRALNHFATGNNVSLDANAGLSVLSWTDDYATQGRALAGKSDIVLWSAQPGAFTGTAISGAIVSQDKIKNRQYYGTSLSTTQILNGQAKNPADHRLVGELPS